jgi:hypothetical protein
MGQAGSLALFVTKVQEGSISFLKKRNKKLLFVSPAWEPDSRQRCRVNRQKFFGSFFQKRTAS